MWSNDFYLLTAKLCFLVSEKGQGLMLSSDMSLIKGRRQVYNAGFL